MAQTVKLEFVQRHHSHAVTMNIKQIAVIQKLCNSAMYMYQLILFNLIRARTYNKF